jgi:hypothetical protein
MVKRVSLTSQEQVLKGDSDPRAEYEDKELRLQHVQDSMISMNKPKAGDNTLKTEDTRSK